MADVMDKVWGNKVVTGDEKAVKPGLAIFKNSDMAIKLLKKHVDNKSMTALHCDVDVDGIGSGYIMGRFLANTAGLYVQYIINKDKVHGIQQKHVDFFKGKPLQFLIIVDSSSNDIDIIKQFECDVLVVDHHEVTHNELSGYTNDGHQFVIVNNTIKNNDIDEMKRLIMTKDKEAANSMVEYDGDNRMSCGLVIYELLRLYSLAYYTEKVLENLMLYQWAGVTLFTDAIILNTPRNQWYIENTIHSPNTESTLKQLLHYLNNFKLHLDKSTINYTIAPILNKAIRASHSGEALNCVVFNPSSILDLRQYADDQTKAIETGINAVNVYETYVTKDMSNTEIHKNYNGVIASRLSGDFNKNAIVYRVVDGIAEGSFRGRVAGTDYRGKFESFNNDTWAQGHKAAFGFRCNQSDINSIMESLQEVESKVASGYLLTAGRLNNEKPGEFTIDDMDEFKKKGDIWRLGIGNSKVSTEEQILITVSSADATLIDQRGKLYTYNVLGLICKAFDLINKPVINIYVEYSNQIDCYIR